jgi:caffeoyl-CoA O-methyltransferase
VTSHTEEILAESKPQWQHHGLITEPGIDDYLYSLLPPRDQVLAEMEEQATRRHIPIVGPVVARILHQLAVMIKARSVFEMGSAIGYSTVWWARAVGESGRVIYTDGDRKNADEARGYFERAGVANRISVRTGDALELLSEQKEEFDIIFNDIDKEDYPRAFRAALPRLRKGGLFITDNVLWSGKVVDQDSADSKTRAIQELNRALYSSADVFTTILPVRDGVAVAIKK